MGEFDDRADPDAREELPPRDYLGRYAPVAHVTGEITGEVVHMAEEPIPYRAVIRRDGRTVAYLAAETRIAAEALLRNSIAAIGNAPDHPECSSAME